ncbi:hypothetical protein [Nocardia cyriacigeorgica]|uniref:hypothetical protein n=1 Tax=Nocardia cyriacigeorgica TaxID=135487 RepID=UPI0018930470|nr:hypothetical protein [Nocardia cyriacigeorgica]MBF6161060.1 hypothetical protein [Nocardia cyriacigeorgica]MBF6199859.1 hypothetical protein [Nocardia cyriacigeorgica]
MNRSTDNTDNTPSGGHLGGFSDLLDRLGIRDDERISLCYRRSTDGKFNFAILARPQAVEFARHGATSETRPDVWFSINPLDPPKSYRGRGGSEHVTRSVCLAVDLDIKDGGLPDPETCEKVIIAVSTILGTEPVAIVATGHGCHAYWALDAEDSAFTLDTDAKRTAVRAMMRRFGRLAADVAASFGGTVDSVFDLARVLRVPGTINYKYPEHPVPVTLTPRDGGVLTFNEVIEALDAYGVSEHDEDRLAPASDPVAPVAGWEFSDATQAYVTGMINGWTADARSAKVVGSRHNWVLAQAVRLQCARRLSLITEDDFAAAAARLEQVFTTLLSAKGRQRKAEPGEFTGMLDWAAALAERKTDEQARHDLGLREGSDLAFGEITAAGIAAAAAALPAKKTRAKTGGPQAGDPRLLPPEFWNQREFLRHIRDAAWARDESPHPVLVAVLALLSAHLHPSVCVETGIKSPLPLNMFVGLVATTGDGKTTAYKFAKRLLRVRLDSGVLGDIAPDAAPRFLALGSGQGISEAYMGTVTVVDPVSGKDVKVHKQVRHNVFLHQDEGAEMFSEMQRATSALGAALRGAWSGELRGQANASKETFRDVEDCVLGVAIGFQRSVLARMATTDEIERGTLQRFLCAPVEDPHAPELDAVPDDPGALEVAELPAGPMHLCETVKRQVRVHSHARRKGLVEVKPLESQKPAMVARTAALLAILDGRVLVTESDWELAEALFAASLAVIEDAIEWGRDQEAVREEARMNLQATAAVVTAAAMDGRASTMDRFRTRIVGYLMASGGSGRWEGRDGIRKRFNSTSGRLQATAARDALIADGTVTFDGTTLTLV